MCDDQISEEEMKKRSRGWVFTMNNYDKKPELVAARDALATHPDLVWSISGFEVGKKCGTPHIQGFVYFKNMKSRKQIGELLGKCFYERQKGKLSDNEKYCSKDATGVVEFGTKPATDDEKGELGKRAIAERWALAKAGRFEELPPEQIRTYEYIYRKFQKPASRPALLGAWIKGKTGRGKSRNIREFYGDRVFSKSIGAGKWWDGYEGEEVVVIEDVHLDHRNMLSYLKDWGDHYSFTAETKGGAMKIRPKIVYITSQYHINEIWKNDEETIEALERRFPPFDFEESQIAALIKKIDDALMKPPVTGLLGPIGRDLDHEGGGNIVPPPDQPYKATQPDGCSEFINNVVG